MRQIALAGIVLVLLQGCCGRRPAPESIEIEILNAFNKYTDANGLRYYTNGKVKDITVEQLSPYAAAAPRRLITVKLNSQEGKEITFRVAREQPCNIKVGDTVAIHGWLRLYEDDWPNKPGEAVRR